MNYYYQSSMGLPGPDKPGMYQSGAGLAGPMPSSMQSAFQQQNGIPPGHAGSYASPSSSFGAAGPPGYSGSPQPYGAQVSYAPTTSFTSSLASSPYSVPITMYGNPHAGLYAQQSLAGPNGAPYLGPSQSGHAGLAGMRLSRPPASTTAGQSLYPSSSPSMAASSMYGYSGLGGPPAPQVGGPLYPSSIPGLPQGGPGSSIPGSSIPGSSIPGASIPGSSLGGSSIPGYPGGASQLTSPLSSYPAQMQPGASPYGLPSGHPAFSRQLP